VFYNMKNRFSDSEIVLFLQEGRNIEAVTTFLFDSVKVPITNFVRSNGGNTDDAKDIIQETLIGFLRLARSNNLPEDIVVLNYLLGIGKKIWYKKIRTDNSRIKRENNYLEELEILNHLDNSINFDEIIINLGEVCRKILKAFYFDDYTYEEIAAMLELGTANSIKVQKHRCLQKLKTVFSL
jgi:RNA polymerase sigma factor (sigma-70 family)